MRRNIIPIRMVALALLLAGNTVVTHSRSIETALGLEQVDPVTAAPEDLQIAARVPQAFRPLAEETFLLGLVPPYGARQDMQRFEFPLQRVQDARLPSWMLKAGAPRYSFRLTDDGADRFRSFQVAAQTARQHGGDSLLSVETPLCRLSDAQTDHIMVSTFVKSGHSSDFVQMPQDRDYSTEIAPADLSAQIPRCA